MSEGQGGGDPTGSRGGGGGGGGGVVLTIIAITGILLTALVAGRGIYLDVALIYALLSFLGVIVVARYLEGGL